MAKPIYSLAKIIAKIAGEKAMGADTTVDYGFFTPAGSGYGAVSALNDTQKTFMHAAMQSWDDVSNLHFHETVNSASANIKIYNVNNSMFAGAQLGDNLMMSSAYGYITNPTLGGYGLLTSIHEIGHSLGLDHPGNYNGGSPTYATHALYAQDSRQYSVMSYFSASNTGANHGGYYASTPLLHDIAAMQKLYGADMTTRTGDTVYGFNSNAGSDAFDFTTNSHPIVCVWDAGGTDTLDVSGFAMAQVIDLTAGNFSDIGGLTKNFSIAYNVAFENAVGGSGNDTMLGNALNNVLSGGAGNDALNGGKGNDTMTGGLGDDSFVVDAVGDVVVEGIGQGTDSVTSSVTYTLGDNVENLTLTGRAALNATGNAVDNVLVGNDAANVLNGMGGNDTMTGGKGNDTYYVDSALDTIVELDRGGTDSVFSSFDFTLSTYLENLTLTGTNNVNGTGNAFANTMTGNAGNNVLTGGFGADILRGGDGADTFVFDTIGGGRDTIKDFSVAQGDVLDVHELLIGFTGAVESFVKFARSGANTLFSIDRDGAGTSYSFVQYATLEKVVGLNVNTLFGEGHLFA